MPDAAAPARSLAQRVLQLEARGAQRGGESEDESCRDPDADAEEERARLELHGLETRDLVERQVPEEAHGPPGKQQPADCTAEGKDETLRQQLQRDSPRAGA